MIRFALRILPSWPWSVGKPGDLLESSVTTDRAHLEDVRRASPNAQHYEVVTVDTDHETVTTLDGATPRHWCIRCGAKSAGIHQPTGSCPGSAP